MSLRDYYDSIVEVPNNKWFSEIPGFEQIPTHSIIYKTKPGMGATFSEIIAKRDSIIILPHVSIIKNKHKQYKKKYKTFAIYGDGQDTKTNDIIDYLISDVKHKKFLTTPRGLEKIKSAVETILQLCERDYLELNYFLLIDEVHKWVKDTGYREDMIPPMEDFFKFKNKAMVSATVLPLSDPRFKMQKFQHVLLKPVHPTEEYKGLSVEQWQKQHPYKKDINVMQVNGVTNGLIQYITENPNDHYCIFFNSIKGIKSLISDLDILKESKIYCSNESKIKLNIEFKGYDSYDEFNVDDSTLAKYNFFTSSFYTGLDIKLDVKPNIIIITDVCNAKYSIVDPYTDVLQIIGRFRDDMYKDIVHIHDYTKLTHPLTDHEIERSITSSMTAYRAIENLYNIALDEDTKQIYAEIMYRSYPFGRFITTTGNYSSYKEDNYRDINRVKVYYCQPYNLIQAYSRTGLFNVHNMTQVYEKDTLIFLKNSPGKYDYNNVLAASEVLVELEDVKGTYLYAQHRHNILRMFPEVIKAYEEFGFKELKRMKFSIRAIRKASRMKDIEDKKVRLPVDLIYAIFYSERSYTRQQIKTKLQKIYDDLGIDAIAKATDISKYFEVKYFNKAVKGVSQNAFYLLDYKLGSSPANVRR